MSSNIKGAASSGAKVEGSPNPPKSGATQPSLPPSGTEPAEVAKQLELLRPTSAPLRELEHDKFQQVTQRLSKAVAGLDGIAKVGPEELRILQSYLSGGDVADPARTAEQFRRLQDMNVGEIEKLLHEPAGVGAPLAALWQEIERLRAVEGLEANDLALNLRARFNVAAREGKVELELLSDVVARPVMGGRMDHRVDLLMHRAGVADAAELAAADARVLQVAEALEGRVFYSPQDITTLQKLPDSKLEKSSEPPDLATRVAIAAKLVSLTSRTPEVLDQLLQGSPGRDPLELVVATLKGDGSTAGFFSSDAPHRFVLLASALWPSDSNSSYDVLTHELIHLLDYSPASRELDGLLPGMTVSQAERLVRVREPLMEEHSRSLAEALQKFREAHPAPKAVFWKLGFDDPLPPEPDQAWWDEWWNKVQGRFRNYFFKDNKEFLSETVSAFKSNPLLLQEALPDLYAVYQEYFDQDPAAVLRESLESR